MHWLNQAEAEAAVGAREVAFALGHIEADLGNESPWHYLRGCVL
jgi:hypothetical protein